MGDLTDFGLFKKNGQGGTLFSDRSTGGTLFSGRTRNGGKAISGLFGVITKPAKAEIKSLIRQRVRKGVKGFFERPKPKPKLTTTQLLELEQKAILKGLRKKERTKKRAKEIMRLERKLM